MAANYTENSVFFSLNVVVSYFWRPNTKKIHNIKNSTSMLHVVTRNAKNDYLKTTQ